MINSEVTHLFRNNVRLWCRTQTYCKVSVKVDTFEGISRMTVFFSMDEQDIYHHDFYNPSEAIASGASSKDFADEAIRGLKRAIKRRYFK